MIEELAIVTKVSPGQVWVKRLQNSACGGCMQQTSCGTATMTKLLPTREFALDCDLDLQEGDRVLVAIDDSHLLFSSVLLYMLPLAVMLSGVGLANAWLPAGLSEAWLPEIALFILLSTFWLINRFQAVLLLHFCFKPQIVAKQPLP